jgi:hypothetical protein
MDRDRTRHDEAPRAPVAWPGLVAVSLGTLVLHAACLTQYGWFRDELYYLSCAKRPAWGYVDQPPFSIAVLAWVVGVAGERLGALRWMAALVGALLPILTGLIARELGGRARAQWVAAAAVAAAPIVLAIGHYYSMNVFDFCFWALATWLALRVLDRPSGGGWIVLGVVLGSGFLNKWSLMWWGAGLAVCLVLPAYRAQLRTAGPWLAAACAGLAFAPHLAWQVRHGWPTLEFMHNARTDKMAALEPAKFLLEQLLVLGPGAAPIWVAGLIAALAPARSRWRPVAIIYLATLVILLASGSARPGYLALATPALFAAGAVWWESRGRLAILAVGALAVLLALPLLPMALPILPVHRFAAYQARLGIAPRSAERKSMGALPQQYADMFGWPELADSVARVAASLPREEFARTIVIVDNYGEAGALERFGTGRLPTIACQHNNWFLWGPPDWDGGTAILVGRDAAEAREEFDEVISAGGAGHPLAMPYERDLPILIVRGFRPDLDLPTAWRAGKHYQ